MFQDNAQIYYSVDLTNGQYAASTGPHFLATFVSVSSLTADLQRQRVLAVWNEGAIPTGIFATASPGGVAGFVSRPTLEGTGPTWNEVRGIGVAEALGSARIYVVDNVPVLYSVDSATGDRSVASANGGPGTGMGLLPFADFAADASGTQLIGLRSPTLPAISLPSGNRMLVSGPDPADGSQRGSGPPIASGVLEVDFANQRAYVLGGEFFLVVDLVSGDRVGIAR